jgi:hypothetical protein
LGIETSQALHCEVKVNIELIEMSHKKVIEIEMLEQ